MALRCGLSIHDYEYMTPYEIMLAVEEYQDRMRLEHEARIVQAYLTAVWQRSRRPPALKKVLSEMRPKEQPRQQTPEEMLTVAMRLHNAISKEGGR